MSRVQQIGVDARRLCSRAAAAYTASATMPAIMCHAIIVAAFKQHGPWNGPRQVLEAEAGREEQEQRTRSARIARTSASSS